MTSQVYLSLFSSQSCKKENKGGGQHTTHFLGLAQGNQLINVDDLFNNVDFIVKSKEM